MLLQAAAARLQAAGVVQPRRDARLLLAEVLQLGPEAIIARPECPVVAERAAAFESLVARRAAREPVSRILGRRGFWGLELRIGPATLDPRPDSETLVEAVLDWWRPRERAGAILDLGTGSGCLLLALLSELPQAWGLGLDRDAGAVAIARDNARALGLAERARFVVGDWAGGICGAWQAIVSNPPYIREAEIDALEPEVAQYEPRSALDGGGDGLAAYRVLAPQIARLLAPGGLAALEIGADQAKDVTQLLTDVGLLPAGCRRDLSGHERCVLATRDTEKL
ncbi:MAG: peptide chain release factor N(5)-glutamine methyltransferase [Kiloniellales bacterium]